MKKDYKHKPQHWETMTNKGKNLFAVLPLIPHLIIIVIILGLYWFVLKQGYFAEWQTYIYYAVKLIIAFEIFAAAARTLLSPIIALLVGVFFVFANYIQQYNFLTMPESWQLIIVALIGFFITIVIKL